MKIPNILINTLFFFTSFKAQVKDIDGLSYKTVVIGEQTWMTENLNVSKFRNGDTIPEVKTYEDWFAAGENQQPAWCYFDNDKGNGTKYGKLYNWFAVNDPRGLAPEGWHIPSDDEWTKLRVVIGENDSTGTTLKSTWGWRLGENNKNGNGTNESGFNGLPGGMRYNGGADYDIGKYGSWWSSTAFNTEQAWKLTLSYWGYNGELVYRLTYPKENGCSVRCIKD